MFVVKDETSRSHEIDEKSLHEELRSSDGSGKPEKLSENIRVKHAHDGTGQPVEQNSSNAHTVKEQFAPESFNADNNSTYTVANGGYVRILLVPTRCP